MINLQLQFNDPRDFMCFGDSVQLVRDSCKVEILQKVHFATFCELHVASVWEIQNVSFGLDIPQTYC